MTEPVAYLVKNRQTTITRFSYEKGDDKKYKNTPLYTAEQLHPRVKMTQAEFDEFKKLLSVGISTIYEAFDVIDSDRGEMDEFEQLYNRLFTNSVNAQAKKQIEFAKLWDSLSICSAEETIEIVPDMKWFVVAKKPSFNGKYSAIKHLDIEDIYGIYGMYGYDKISSDAYQFDTKEEAEKWTNPLTEAVQLPVEDE